MENLIQVAGIIDQAEADLLVGCGVDWLGVSTSFAVRYG